MIELLAIGGAVVAIIAVFAGVVWLAERKAKAELDREQLDEYLRRLQDAVEADARERGRIDGGKLLQNDGHRRD